MHLKGCIKLSILILFRYKGIGIRIEDNILITQDGNQVLTKDVPKEIEEIEDIMSQKSSLSEYVFKNFSF